MNENHDKESGVKIEYGTLNHTAEQEREATRIAGVGMVWLCRVGDDAVVRIQSAGNDDLIEIIREPCTGNFSHSVVLVPNGSGGIKAELLHRVEPA